MVEKNPKWERKGGTRYLFTWMEMDSWGALGATEKNYLTYL